MRCGETRKRVFVGDGDVSNLFLFHGISRDHNNATTKSRRLACRNQWLFALAAMIGTFLFFVDPLDRETVLSYSSPSFDPLVPSVQGTNSAFIINQSPTVSTSTLPSSKPTKSAVKQRWNAKKLMKIFDRSVKDKSAYTMNDLLDFAPKPSGEDIEIYHRNAWHRLRTLLGMGRNPANSSPSNVTICSIGGSSTAGGGGIPPPFRWDAIFKDMLLITQPTSNIHVVNRGHGWRGSLHAAFLLQSLVPSETDILIWEFAMNDGHEKGCEEINNGIILFLEHVAHHLSPPPLVILSYLWTFHGAKNLTASVFQCHNRIGAAYDFVVGSVNLFSYLQEPAWNYNSMEKYVLADHLHPGWWGHQLLGFLLWDLVVDEERTVNRKTILPLSSRPTPHFHCHAMPSTKQKLSTLIEKKYAFASWTSELPRNEMQQKGMLEPKLFSKTNNAKGTNMTFVLHGKVSDARQDRKLALVLPCCDTEDRIGFDMESSATDEVNKDDSGGRWVSAMLLHSPEAVSVQGADYKVVFDHDLVPNKIMVGVEDVNGTEIWNSKPMSSYSTQAPVWISFDKEECRLGEFYLNPWLVLPDERLVSRITMCNMDPRCRQADVSPISLMHMALI